MTKKENIRKLLDKYFEGSTSCKEEQLLRNYFTSCNIPEDLKVYKPIFEYMDEQAKEVSITKRTSINHNLFLRYTWGAIAATLLLILGFTAYSSFNHSNNNYVIINGEKYTNVRLAQQQAQKAFDEVSFSKDDVTNDLIPEDMKEGFE